MQTTATNSATYLRNRRLRISGSVSPMNAITRRREARSQCFAPPIPKENCAGLFKFLIGNGHERIRDIDAKRFRGLEVDDQLESIRSFDRHAVRLCAAEDAAGVPS